MKMKYMPAMGQGFDHPEIALNDISNNYYPTISGLIDTYKSAAVGVRAMHKALWVWRWIKGIVTSHAGQSFGFLRCSALSLRPQASSTHDEKLALGLSAFSCSTLASISLIISCGKRIPIREDLLFLLPVAMVNNLLNALSEGTPYRKNIANKILDVAAHQNIKWLHTLSTGKVQATHKIAKPGSALTLTGPLTKPLKEVTIMAESQHTQTHPKFTWRFLALGATDRGVLRIIATTEREARDQSPEGCVVVFAGRLPVKAVCHGT